MFAELGFCASVRTGDTAALVDRFRVATDKADQLLSRPIVELAVAKAIEAMPLD